MCGQLTVEVGCCICALCSQALPAVFWQAKSCMHAVATTLQDVQRRQVRSEEELRSAHANKETLRNALASAEQNENRVRLELQRTVLQQEFELQEARSMLERVNAELQRERGHRSGAAPEDAAAFQDYSNEELVDEIQLLMLQRDTQALDSKVHLMQVKTEASQLAHVMQDELRRRHLLLQDASETVAALQGQKLELQEQLQEADMRHAQELEEHREELSELQQQHEAEMRHATSALLEEERGRLLLEEGRRIQKAEAAAAAEAHEAALRKLSVDHREELMAMAAEHSSAMQQVQAALQAAEAAREAATRDAARVLQSCQDELANTTTLMHGAEALASELLAAKTALEGEGEALSQQLRHEEGRLAEAKAEIAAAKVEIAEARAEIAELEDRLEHAETQAGDLQVCAEFMASTS